MSQPLFASKTDTQWYRCIVKASSHLAFYTFRIRTVPCEIYWREINTSIKIKECKPPIISGLKPSAQDKYSVVWFNLETGAFYDYLSGVKDRGICTAHEKEPKPFASSKYRSLKG
jgi:hypothetical protein